MAAFERGRNAGITGIIDLPGQGAKFSVRCYGWNKHLSVESRNRMGRGTGKWKIVRHVLSTGHLACTFEVRADGFPLPTTFEGEGGSITITYSGSRKVVIPIHIDTCDMKADEKTEDRWVGSFHCDITGQPVFSGWPGTQAAGTDASQADQLLDEGMSKQYDPDGIQDGASQLYDVWNLTDTDAGEMTKIGTLIAAAQAPISGLKARFGGLVSRDRRGGVISITWARTTTGEDVINEATSRSIDPLGIASHATSAAFNGTPATPTETGLVKRVEHSKVINSAKTLRTDEYGTRSTKQDIEQDGSYVEIDPYDLKSRGIKTSEFTTVSGEPPDPTPPTGLRIASSTVQEVNDAHSKKVWNYAKSTSKQEVEQGNTFTKTDPNGLDSASEVASVDGSPALASGFVSRGVKVQALNPEHNLSVIEGGVRDTMDDRQMPNRFTKVDPVGLETEGRWLTVHNTGSTPSVPAAPAGTKLIGTTPTELDRVHSQTVWEFGVANSQNRYEWGSSHVIDDPRDIEDETVIGLVQASSAPSNPATPSGLKLAERRTPRQLTDGSWLHEFVYRRMDSKDKLEWGATHKSTDPNAIEDETVIALVQSSSTPSAPPTPAGLKLVETLTPRQLTDGQWLHQWVYAKLDSADKTLFPHIRVTYDPHDLEGEQTAAVLFPTGSTPSDPPVPAGLYFIEYIDTPRTSEQSIRVWRYGKLTSASRLVLPHNRERVDPNGFESEQTAAVLDGTPTLSSGLVERVTETLHPNPDHFVKVTSGGVRDTKDDREMPGTWVYTDPSNLDSKGQQTSTFATGGAEPAAVVPVGQVITGSKLQVIDRVHSEKVYETGVETTQQALERGHTWTEIDPDGLRNQQVKAKLDAADVLDAGFVARSTRTRVVKGRTLYMVEGGLRGTKDDEEMAGTVSENERGRASGATIITVKPCSETDTADTLFLTEAAILITAPTFLAMSVRKIDRTHYRLTVQYRANDLISDGESTGGMEWVSARVNSGAVQVYMAERMTMGTGIYRVRIAQQRVMRIRKVFTVERLKAQEPLNDAFYLDRIGTKNQTNFLGWPAGTVTYLGQNDHTNFSLGPPPTRLIYRFLYDNLGQLSEDDVTLGWYHTDADLSSAVPGWIDAGTFGWTAAPMPDANFSVFLL